MATLHALTPQAASKSPADLLAEARRAYREKQAAKSTLSRLRTYRGQTPGMRHDASMALQRLDSANATLDRILGGAA